MDKLSFREQALAWVRNLDSEELLHFLFDACRDRQFRSYDATTVKFAIAQIEKDDGDDDWLLRLVGAEDSAKYEGNRMETNHPVIRSAKCACGNNIGSWATFAICPVCGKQLSCY